MGRVAAVRFQFQRLSKLSCIRLEVILYQCGGAFREVTSYIKTRALVVYLPCVVFVLQLLANILGSAIRDYIFLSAVPAG